MAVTSSPPELARGVPPLQRRRLPRMQETGLIIVILVIGLFLWVASGSRTQTLPAQDVGGVHFAMEEVQQNGFLRLDNIVNSVFRDMSWTAIMAIGVTFVIVSGGIDISVGSTMGLSAFITALVLLKFPPDASPWVVVPLGILVPCTVGLVCGLINGSLVVGLRMHPFIVSLATLSIFRWASEKLGEVYKSASVPFGREPIPQAFTDYFIEFRWLLPVYGGRRIEILNLVPILFMIGALILGWIYLRHTVWGRETYAVGGNEEAARFSGIRIGAVKLRVYALCGLAAGIAGMLNCGYYKSAAVNTGTGYELTVIAAAVVGGASLDGGRGTALGAVLGMLVLQLIMDGIMVLGSVNLGFVQIPVKKSDTELIYGVAIIVAVAVDQFSTYLQSRRSARLRAAH
jgi:ribose/xylose/arabinose/galactoside ABC-type transport system permease subunit